MSPFVYVARVIKVVHRDRRVTGRQRTGKSLRRDGDVNEDDAMAWYVLLEECVPERGGKGVGLKELKWVPVLLLVAQDLPIRAGALSPT